MPPRKEQTKIGREKLQRIIEICKSIEERSVDPFLIDVKEVIATLKEYFSNWQNPEDLCLDAETIHHIASVIKLQSEWVKHRSTSLYKDPFLLEEKIRKLGKAEIVETFLRAWHPIVELEQLSLQSIVEAVKYWHNLLPLKDRFKTFSSPQIEVSKATRKELIDQKILLEKAFSEELENLWRELRAETAERSENGKIKYWDFIETETYEKTVYRAFMTSFLVSYGYATLEIHPLEEEIYIKPYEKPQVNLSKKHLLSVPIAISREDWLKHKGEK